MHKAVPTLDSTRVVHFDALDDYREALRSALANEWLFVAPKMTIQLFRSFQITLRHTGDVDQLSVKATPTYWRGPYLGMQVECTSTEARDVARSILNSLQEGSPLDSGTAAAVADSETLDGVFLDENPKAGAEKTESVDGDKDGFEVDPELFGLDVDTEPSAEVPVVDDEGLESNLPDEYDANEEESFEDEATVKDSNNEDGSPGASTEWFVRELTDSGSFDAGFSELGNGLVGEKSAPRFGGSEGATPEIIGGTAIPITVPATFLEPFFSADQRFYLPERVTYYRLLATLARHELTGLVRLETSGGIYSIYVRSGNLMAVDPPGMQFDDHIGRVLVEEGWCNAGQVRANLRTSRAQGLSLAIVLYQKGILSLDILSRYLRAEKEELLRQVLNLPVDSEFAIFPSSGFTHRSDPVRIPLTSSLAMFMRQTLLDQPTKALAKMVSPWQEMHPRFRDNLAMGRNALSLARQEIEVVDTMLKGLHNLREIQELAPFRPRELHILLLMLNHFGFVDWVDEAMPREGEEDIEGLLQRRYRDLKGMDHFQRLSLHWAVHPQRVEQAYRSYLSRYGADSSLASGSDEAAAICKAILGLCKRSFDFLSVREKRVSLRQERMGTERIEYAVRFLANQARQSHSKGQLSNAIFLLESSLDLVPGPENEETLASWRARAKGKST